MRPIRFACFLAAAVQSFAQCPDKTDYSLDVVLYQASGKPIPAGTKVRITLDAFPRNAQPRPEIRDGGRARPAAPEGTYEVCIPEGKGVSINGKGAMLNISWAIGISADGFRSAAIGPAALTEEGRHIQAASRRPIQTTLIRDSRRWEASFRCSDSFRDSAQFAALERTLSGDVYLKQHGFLRKPFVNLGSLDGPRFSDVRPKDDVKVDRDTLNRARAALLNIYHSLTSPASCGGGPGADRDWFWFVKEIHVIDGERFLAKAKTAEEAAGQDVFEAIQRQGEQFQGFACNTSVAADSILHRFEDPRSAHWDKAQHKIQGEWQSSSIKTPLCQGNIQVTAARFADETLLDFDIDEHFDILLHFADLGKHLATHGTDAYEMAEMLALRDRNLGYSYDFGFSLVPRQQDAAKNPLMCEDSRPRLRPSAGAHP
jgi:hypothetical protein